MIEWLNRPMTCKEMAFFLFFMLLIQTGIIEIALDKRIRNLEDKFKKKNGD